MGDVKGFLKCKRREAECRPVCERVLDYKEVGVPRSDEQSREQTSRCMDCGIPFCHWACPIGNYIPEWNDAVHNQQWEKAYELLSATNPLPEVTGRVCPALCEYACVLGINDDPVTVRENELAVAEYAFKHNLVKPRPPKKRTGKKAAVIGSGPAGLSAAVFLNKMGHKVTVFEQDDKIGGIMRYGIPDFKLDKKILDRRIEIWKEEGIKFKTRTEVAQIPDGFDAVCYAVGCRTPRDLEIPGRELKGIHFAMDYLTKAIDSKGKKVVVIGGGDTGADCLGTVNRRGAACVVQIEILPKPPQLRAEKCPWPKYPLLLKTTSSHEEGCERHWSVRTKEFVGKHGKVEKLICESDEREFEIEADVVILAVGFIKQEISKEWKDKKVFVAGDVARGPSLIVWAIYEGRRAADEIESYLSA